VQGALLDCVMTEALMSAKKTIFVLMQINLTMGKAVLTVA